MQRFSIFHSSPEETLRAWHRPYADVFLDCAPVLDVGCGLGYFADLLTERSIECVGLDVDPAMVAACESRGHVARCGDQRSLSQFDRQFGGIHISHVIEHLWGEEIIELLEQCVGCLRDGGCIVIRTPNWEVEEVRNRVFWSDHTHRRPYALEVITRILTDFGFTIEAAGAEPYGLNDLYAIGIKGVPHRTIAKPDFSRDPFPRPSRPLISRVPKWLKDILRPLRESVQRRNR